MSSETQVRTSHQPAKKLRSSCDACGFAKTKCDRGHPQCTRCVSLSLTCIYGPSRQVGKRPRRRLDIARDNNTNSAHISGNSPACTITTHPPNVSNGGTECGPQYSSTVTMSSIDGTVDTNFDNFLSTGNDNFDQLMFPPTLDGWTPPQREQHFDNFNPIITPDNDVIIPTTQEGLENLAPTPAVSDISEKHRCYHEPNEILQSLTITNIDLGDKATGRPPMNVLPLPQILHANKSAVESFQRFLDCNCGRRRPELVMLQASLVSRVLFFYREAAGFAVKEMDRAGARNDNEKTGRKNDTTPPSSTSSSPPPGSTTPTASPPTTITTSTPPSPQPLPKTYSQSCFTITDPPFRIGTFDIEHPGIQFAFRNQLIASEVRKVLPIVSGFAALGKEDSMDKVVDGADHRAMFSSVGSWLESEYRRTVEVFRGACTGMGRAMHNKKFIRERPSQVKRRSPHPPPTLPIDYSSIYSYSPTQ
ncbi:unnamed protein product [Periconia digitata]|uniref:Zn(2)-C6 fungal-type domain-containing protein n=1 Tax=Periconia digitata TaxID=1303443 RepID=A0A9W4XMD9_9PLEO|nr:unnamed protein product [Periconia digitata]